MQRTYQIKLSLSSCSSIPAISPAVWKEKFFQITAIAKDRFSSIALLFTDVFKLHNSGPHTGSKLAPYKIAFREETKWAN